MSKLRLEDFKSYEEYINIADKLKEIWPDAYNNNCLVVNTGEVVRTSDNTKGSGMSIASSFTSKGFDACVYNNQIRARVICKKDFLSKSTTTKYSKCTCPSGQVYDGATGECIDYCPNKVQIYIKFRKPTNGICLAMR